MTTVFEVILESVKVTISTNTITKYVIEKSGV